MSTTPIENNQSFEAGSEDFSASSSESKLSDDMNSDLYSDLSLFNKDAGSHKLPGLEIAGLGDEPTAIALRDGGPKSAKTQQGDTPESKDREIKANGMVRVPGEDHGNADVYKPANGSADKQGRTQVELIHQSGVLQYEQSTYADGKHVSKEFGADGKVTSTTTTNANGEKTTSYPGITSDSDKMKAAYENGGAAALTKEIDSVLKQGGNWGMVQKMLDEAKSKNVPIYPEGNNIKVNDGTWPFAGDSTIATKPADPPAAPKEPTPPASGMHPAAKGFVPSWWSKDVTDALKK